MTSSLSLGDSPVQQFSVIEPNLAQLASLGGADDDHVLLRGTVPAEMAIPLHSHDDLECVSVVGGSLDVYHGGPKRWYRLGTGESILIAPGIPHAIRNVSGAPADTLLITTVRLARFLKELDAIAAASGRDRPREERMSSLRALAEQYGHWLASPDQNEAIGRMA